MKKNHRAVLLVASLGLAIAADAAPAAASCAPPPPMAEALDTADLVVVGTVTGTRGGDRVAAVTVEDVWKGDPARRIVIVGGPEGDDVSWSTERTYAVGTRYLFVVDGPDPDTGGYHDSICTNTTPYEAALARHRPELATRIGPATPIEAPVPATRGSMAPVLGGAAAAVVTTIAAVWFTRRRRHAPPTPR